MKDCFAATTGTAEEPLCRSLAPGSAYLGADAARDVADIARNPAAKRNNELRVCHAYKPHHGRVAPPFGGLGSQ